MKNIKQIDIKEFRDFGYLQELNRLFLHPLGMALEIVINADGTEKLGEIWDYRNDPDGMIFGKGIIDEEKANRVDSEWKDKYVSRMKSLGFMIQPIKRMENHDKKGG